MKKKILSVLVSMLAFSACMLTLTSCKDEYTVTWQNWDGTVLEVDYEVEEETIPAYDGTTPKKQADAQYSYEFIGWDKEISAVTGDTVYTAQFNAIVNSYTVTWKNWDGSVLELDESINYGTLPAYDGDTPAKQADAQYTYTFSGWDSNIDVVTGDITYTAQFSNVTNAYNVTWQNWDGTILELDENIEYGEMPTYNGETPQKAGNAQYTYTFSGWEPVVDIVTGNVTYVAQYSYVINKYTVTWQNWDGSVLELDENVEYGEAPTYDGDTPYKASDTKGNYTFTGWSPTVDVVTGDIACVAQFSTELKKYTVTWKNWDGTVLETDENIEYGTMPTYNGSVPTKEGSAQYTYTFSGWDQPVNLVTSDTIYVAQFSNATNSYTVTWKNWDGCVLEIDENIEYGTTPTYDASVPTKEGNAQYTYAFSGWEPTVDALIGDIVYVAQFSESINKYTVTWKNWDGSVLKTDVVEYGTMPSYDGQVPTKEADIQYTYEFSGWDKELSNVIENVEYTAQFKQHIINYSITYNLQGGENNPANPATYTALSETFTLLNPTKTGYTFVGWTYADQTMPQLDVIIVQGTAGEKEYTANWQANKYTVTYEDTNQEVVVTFNYNYDGSTSSSVVVAEGQILKYPAPPMREGYAFSGWYTDSACTTSYEFSDSITKDMTLYAKWVTMAYSYTYREYVDMANHTTSSRAKTISAYGLGDFKYTYYYFTCYTSGTYTLHIERVSHEIVVEKVYNVTQGMTLKSHSDLEPGDGLSLAFNANAGDVIYVQCFKNRKSDPVASASFYVSSVCYPTSTAQVENSICEYSNGTSVSKTVTFNSSFELPTLIRTGYTFLGWYNGDDKFELESDVWNIASDVTITPKWQANEYTLTLDGNGVELAETTILVTYGEEYALPVLTRTGYTFLGWIGVDESGIWEFAYDKSLKASWKANVYNVTYQDSRMYTYTIDGDNYSRFYYQAGTTYTEQVTFGKNYRVLLPESRDGYTFLGWYYGEEKVVSGIWNYASDIVLTPLWNAHTYIITLDGNGVELDEKQITVTYETEYTLPELRKTGYTFLGWYSGNSRYMGGKWYGTSNVTLQAKWEVNSYQVTLEDILTRNITVAFDYQYSGCTNFTVTLTNGRILNRPENPTRKNYIFTGWYTDSSCTKRFDFAGIITDDMTLYGGWRYMDGSLASSQVQIDPSNYMSNSSCYSCSAPQLYGSSYIAYRYIVAEETGIHCIYRRSSNSTSKCYLSIKNLTTQEYIGKDTSTSSTSYDTYTFTCSKGDIIVIESYSDNGTTQYLYFSGFSSPYLSSCIASPACVYDEKSAYKYSVEFDENYTLPTPVRAHYTFLGWYNGEEKVESGAWKITSDTVLVPKWERREYEITYNLDGGTNAVTNPYYYAKDDEITLIAPTKPGYKFLGWTGSNGDVPELNVTFSGEDFIAREYTAHWEVAIFTVDYVLNGGTNPAKNPTAITMYDEFELKAPTKTEYIFEGWYLDGEFTQPISSLTNVTSDITLYAKFAPKKYTATFNTNGAETSDPITITLHTGVNSTTKAVILNNGDSFSPYDYWQPKIFGYVFVGWMHNSELIGNKIEATGDIDLYAKWVENPNGYPVLGEDVTSIYSNSQTTYFFISYNYTRIRYELGASHSYYDVISSTTHLVTHTYYASGFGFISANGLDISSPTWPHASRENKDWDKSGYATLEPGTLVKIGSGKEGDHVNVHVYGYANVEIAGATTHNNTITVSDKRIKTQEYDSAINVPNASKTGYYVEWYDGNGNLMTDTWQYTQNQVFTAKWKPINYNIVYNLDGGTNSMSNPSNYTIEDVLELSNPSKVGYTFAGWYLDGDFTQKITSINHTTGDYTLYAKFTPNTYNATLDFDGGILAPNVSFVSDGEVVDSYYLTADISMESYYPPAKEGYIFAGWYTDESCQTVFDFSKVITEDITLYTKWISSDITNHQITTNEVETESIVVNGTNEIKITFVPLASGKITITTSSQLDVKGILYNENMVKVVEADDISDENYNFSITYNVEVGKQYTIAIKGATTLTKGDCDVLFDFVGSMGISGTTYTSFTFEVVYDSTFELPTPTKQGFEFLGWFDENGNEVTSSTWSYAQDTTLYAQWSAIG